MQTILGQQHPRGIIKYDLRIISAVLGKEILNDSFAHHKCITTIITQKNDQFRLTTTVYIYLVIFRIYNALNTVPCSLLFGCNLKIVYIHILQGQYYYCNSGQSEYYAPPIFVVVFDTSGQFIHPSTQSTESSITL